MKYYYWEVVIYILIAISAGVCICTLYQAFSEAKKINKDYKNPYAMEKMINSRINGCYNVFIGLVSIFPLLGMLGTVVSLLGLDLNVGDDEILKTNFFHALGTTAAGLVCSIAFKFVNSLCQYQIETAINLLQEYKRIKLENVNDEK